MTEHSAPLLTIAKPNQSRTIVLQPSNTSETHCDQSPLKVDSKCSFVNICNPLQNESKHLHNLPTPSQSCTMAAISMRNSPRLREYCDILQNDRRRGTEGQRALVKLRQLRASRTSSDLYFDAHGNRNLFSQFSISLSQMFLYNLRGSNYSKYLQTHPRPSLFVLLSILCTSGHDNLYTFGCSDSIYARNDSQIYRHSIQSTNSRCRTKTGAHNYRAVLE